MGMMMNFMKDMLRMPWPWVAWVGLLMLVNAGGGLVYLATLEGRVVLGTFVLAALLLTAIHARLGFVRLMGLGHFVWLPMIVWLAQRLGDAPAGSALRLWLWAVIVLNGASLVIDAVDVLRYLRGERAPTIPAAG